MSNEINSSLNCLIKSTFGQKCENSQTNEKIVPKKYIFVIIICQSLQTVGTAYLVDKRKNFEFNKINSPP